MIRTATAADIPALVPLWRAFMDFHRDLDPRFARAPGAEAHWSAYLADRLDDPAARVLVAEADGAVVGYAMALVKDHPPIRTLERYGLVQEIMVASEHRRRGVARRLVDAAVAWLREQGMIRLEVGIDVDNPASRALFRAAGFVPRAETLVRDFDPPPGPDRTPAS